MNVILYKTNIALTVILCTALFSCDLEFWKESSPVIAEVENSQLRINELKESRYEGDSVSKDEWVHRIDEWINSEVMYREAIKRGLQKDPATQKLIKDAERKILIDKLRLTIDNTIYMESDKKLQEYYENNKEHLFRIDSASYMSFEDALPQIQSAMLSERQASREKKWLTEIKNLYTIEVYPQYLDSLK